MHDTIAAVIVLALLLAAVAALATHRSSVLQI
jgi:hypothetical protein